MGQSSTATSAAGALDLREKCAPGGQAARLLPWFKAPGRRSAGERIVFGHWSTLGFHEESGAVCLDTGCLWGGELTALCLDGGGRFSVGCGGAARQAPGD